MLLINEFDFDSANTALRLFQDNYLSVPHNGAEPIRLPVPVHGAVQHRHPVGLRPQQQRCRRRARRCLRLRVLPRPVRDGRLLEHPIDERDIRTFQNFLLEGHARCAACPTTRPRPRRATGTRPTSSTSSGSPPRATGTSRSGSAARPSTSWRATRRRRCSTDPRTATARATSTRSASGPTTSRPAGRAATSTTTKGERGGLESGSRFVIAGDQNSDPLDGDSIPGVDPAAARPPARQHEGRRRRALGAVEQARAAGWREPHSPSDPTFDTADFADAAPGNLRADYVLPRQEPARSAMRPSSGR